MKLSASIELVWQTAAQEAIASEHKDIEPEHFLAALLKFAELPSDELERMAPGSQAVKELIAELELLRRELDDRAIETTRVRRDLRARIGKGNAPYDGGAKHRSAALRDVFDAAARLADDAGSPTMTPCHMMHVLLATPTPVMAEVLKRARLEEHVKPARTPLIAEMCQEVVPSVAEGKLEVPAGRPAETLVVLQALAQSQRSCLLLLTESQEMARTVVLGVAGAIATKHCPSAIKGQRILEVTSDRPANDDECLDKLLAEVAGEKIVILVLPPVTPKSGDYAERLKMALARKPVPCIVRVHPLVYEASMMRDAAWKKLAHAMWIQAEVEEQVPDEL